MTEKQERRDAAIVDAFEAWLAASDRVETAHRAVIWLGDSPEARAYRDAVDASERARAAYFAAKAA